MAELFPREIPRDFRVIFRDPDLDRSVPGIDLVAAMAKLDQDTSIAGTLVELGSLQRIAEETGDRLDGLLAECIGKWLELKKRITKQQKREAKTMAQVVTEYERSLEAFGTKRWREGRVEGRVEGRREGLVAALCGVAERRFGAKAGERLAELLGTPPDSGRLATAAAAVADCSTAEELLQRVEGSAGD